MPVRPPCCSSLTTKKKDGINGRKGKRDRERLPRLSGGLLLPSSCVLHAYMPSKPQAWKKRLRSEFEAGSLTFPHSFRPSTSLVFMQAPVSLSLPLSLVQRTCTCTIYMDMHLLLLRGDGRLPRMTLKIENRSDESWGNIASVSFTSLRLFLWSRTRQCNPVHTCILALSIFQKGAHKHHFFCKTHQSFLTPVTPLLSYPRAIFFHLIQPHRCICIYTQGTLIFWHFGQMPLKGALYQQLLMKMSLAEVFSSTSTLQKIEFFIIPQLQF